MATRTLSAQQALPYHSTTVPVAQRVDQLDADLRRELIRLIGAVGHVPHRAFTEIACRKQPRPMGTRTIARALIAARLAGAPRERALTVAFAFVGWVMALWPADASHPEAYRTECREQAEADPVQGEAAFNARDLAALERAIEETRDHLAALYQLHAHQLRQREALLCGA